MDTLNDSAGYCSLAPSQGGRLFDSVHDPRTAYDLGASYYDTWTWQTIWRDIEWPSIDDIVYRISTRIRGTPSILDLGIGTGSYLQYLGRRYDIRNCCGVDVSERMLEIARSKLKNGPVLSLGDARDLRFPDASFDVVLLCRVASHLSDICSVASEVRRVLRRGGIFIISDLHPNHPYQFTRIPFGGAKLSIMTYKHSIKKWMDVAAQLGFWVEVNRTISSEDARRSSVQALPSTIASSPPHLLSFIISARKHSF